MEHPDESPFGVGQDLLKKTQLLPNRGILASDLHGLQVFNDGFHCTVVTGKVPAMVRCQLTGVIGDQGTLVWSDVFDKLHEAGVAVVFRAGKGIPLDIELHSIHARQ